MPQRDQKKKFPTRSPPREGFFLQCRRQLKKPLMGYFTYIYMQLVGNSGLLEYGKCLWQMIIKFVQIIRNILGTKFNYSINVVYTAESLE